MVTVLILFDYQYFSFGLFITLCKSW